MTGIDRYIRPSVAEDVRYLSANLRKEDEEEVAAGGFHPLLALQHGYTHSRPCLTGVEPTAGKPAFMTGSVPCERHIGFGRVWLLGTIDIERHPLTFLRHCAEARDMLFQGYAGLYNYTYEKNTLHHKWLKWMGFHLIQRVELTPNHFFYEFVGLPSQGSRS